ncbi:MAG: hypothetical protein COY66_03480 [Candidatus Kerfeldbacteria bacterium CG_4_10_14_0_8_um_filter_42_10]|uniref:Orotate phosphoribosyltransferase n=1 Tax=Candidatus Kerfeldbacteria bacterium CG_4_10_14_0_8_um_filter_42_10 TaxID=2014248 RepID=A0A2M7RIV8_9BACT|nr:MAG: hypothetical protein COY66_03480 [Candidatus Kerfeldbacteria bacterium CG_4_10_14_0_8_um_filter_42_10]
MRAEDLPALRVEDVNRPLTPEEMVHLARIAGAFWIYDYEALKRGKAGMHAVLKSGRHSDGFFISRILLALENIRLIISAQMTMRIMEALTGSDLPSCVAGVPDGATKLGQDIGRALGIPFLKMEKTDRISLLMPINPKSLILLVEDFCTRGTGFTEAVNVIKASQPLARFVPYNPVIINRGGLKRFAVENVGEFEILPIVEHRVDDWEPEDCPLCAKGSVPIKPKATDENWRLITASQL